MNIDHIAIWTADLERLKNFYVKYFDGRANRKYINPVKQFESYFISFESGARLELMQKPQMPPNINDTIGTQHLGIIHISFGMNNMEEVSLKCKELERAGFKILQGPRKTGDGYFEFETLDPDNNRIEVSALYTDSEISEI